MSDDQNTEDLAASKDLANAGTDKKNPGGSGRGKTEPVGQSDVVTPYAIISDGGRQYRVTEGQTLDIDFREGLEDGNELVFDRVLAFSDGKELKFGAPVLEGFSIKASVVGIARGEKIYVQKFRRRKNSRRRTGHRQTYTRVQIEKLV